MVINTRSQKEKDKQERARVRDIIHKRLASTHVSAAERSGATSNEVEDTKAYEIESLRRRRIVRRGTRRVARRSTEFVTQYLVKWKGYNSQYDQWLDLQDLTNATTLVNEYDASHPLDPRETQSGYSPDSSSKAFRIFDLPAELRNRIWEAVVHEPEKEFYLDTLQCPAIATVSHQVCSEALPIFFAVNSFYTAFHKAPDRPKYEFELAPATQAWLRSLMDARWRRYGPETDPLPARIKHLGFNFIQNGSDESAEIGVSQFGQYRIDYDYPKLSTLRKLKTASQVLSRRNAKETRSLIESRRFQRFCDRGKEQSKARLKQLILCTIKYQAIGNAIFDASMGEHFRRIAPAGMQLQHILAIADRSDPAMILRAGLHAGRGKLHKELIGTYRAMMALRSSVRLSR